MPPVHAHARGPARRPGKQPERGVALILVLITVAILSSLAVDFSYGSRVQLRLAENARDEMRAYFLARSAVNMSRLLLRFQKQIDTQGAELSRVLARLSPPTPGKEVPPAPGGSASPPGGGAPTLGIRLWELLPIKSNLLSTILAGGHGLGGGGPGAAAGAARGAATEAEGFTASRFGQFDGFYEAKISDENSRINVVGLDGLSNTPRATLIQLRAMMANSKYDFIFDEEDANRDKVRRDDVILAMKDWIDPDETGSGIDPSNTRSPIVNAGGDENGAYARYTPRYKAKNAKPDSLEELYMVRGVNDRFMAAFGDRLTVWPDVNDKLNVNTDDPEQMRTNIRIAALRPNDPALDDPRLMATILQEIQLRKKFSFFGLSSADFVAVLKQNGIQVQPELESPNSPGNFLGSTSNTFRITATGRVGRTEKTITTVVKYDDLLGKMMYWKED